jgi:peroxiredoxin
MMIRNLIAIILLGGLISFVVYDYVMENKEQTSSVQKEQEQEHTNNDKGTEKEVVGLKVGNVAPDFTISTLNGEIVSLSDYRGKPVILNMWATWCTPCRAEMPEMQNFYDKHKDEVHIVAVNLTANDSVESVKEFVNDYGITFPILLDTNNFVGVSYRVLSIPSTWFLDKNGIVYKRHVGPMDEAFMENVVGNLK